MNLAFTEEMLPPNHTSWNKVLASLDTQAREDIIASLSDGEVVDASTDWFLQARREQIPPLWNWFVWIILAGRGFGKNWAGSNWLIQQHVQGFAKNSGIVAATASDLNKYCIDGPSGILALAPPWFFPDYQPSKTRLVWPNGTKTSLFTSEKPDRLRGPNLDKVWCDELAAWQKLDETWDMLQLCLRYGSDPQAIITTTPRPKKVLRDLMKRENKDVAVTRGSTYDNAANLSPRFIQEIIREYSGTQLERQEIYGELLDEFEGALWSYSILDRNRVTEHPVLSRVGVGVDPALSSEEGADLTGIISGGMDSTGHGYVLGDHSLRASPEGWARKVVAVYEDIEADFIVAEKNVGGEMVESTIRAVSPNANVILVHAQRAKVTRAEPISARYEQGRIHHVGTLPDLEDQMCLFLPGTIKKSPDRADALVWLFTELLGQANRTVPRIRSL
ncbi:hypothetical protein LCGC14_1672740 [marine sediment metagenome]|uniref:Terminase large subunit gp17-like C-terminal domain-containing protein n=1 Tax=marine sediment metagenome TaxID=412755 RepID=A0A0F9KQN8_9ZZZZ